MKIALMLAAVLASGQTPRQDTAPIRLDAEALVGTWTCGPTLMHGPDFDLSVTSTLISRGDGTFVDYSNSHITRHNGNEIDVADSSSGRWRVEDDLVIRTVEQVRFISSSDPTITPEFGQRNLEIQLAKKHVYTSRILSFIGNETRSLPVGSMYKEAEVESVCRKQISGAG